MLVKRTVEKRRARDLKVRANVRKTFPPEAELRALARSFMRRAIHPLIISVGNVIYDGECRHRGLMLENPDFEADVIVVDRELTPAEVCEIQMISAMHSTSLSSYDQALACKEWMTQNPGATAKQLAEKIDRDASMVGILLSLWRCTPAVIEAAAQNKIGPKAWKQISFLPEEEQSGLLELHLAGMPAAQIAEISRKKRNGSAVVAQGVTRLKSAIPGRKATLQIVFEQDTTLEGMIEAVQEWVKIAKKESDRGSSAKTLERVCRDLAKKG
jgi:hypothetical protein